MQPSEPIETIQTVAAQPSEHEEADQAEVEAWQWRNDEDQVLRKFQELVGMAFEDDNNSDSYEEALSDDISDDDDWDDDITKVSYEDEYRRHPEEMARIMRFANENDENIDFLKGYYHHIVFLCSGVVLSAKTLMVTFKF